MREKGYVRKGKKVRENCCNFQETQLLPPVSDNKSHHQVLSNMI